MPIIKCPSCGSTNTGEKTCFRCGCYLPKLLECPGDDRDRYTPKGRRYFRAEDGRIVWEWGNMSDDIIRKYYFAIAEADEK